MTEQKIVELAEKHGLCTIIPDAGYTHDALWFDANLIEFATAVAAAEREACAKKLPDVLFDGYAVMQQLDKRGQARTSQENVSDVLDAVVRIMRANAAMSGSPASSATPLDGTVMQEKDK